MWDDQEQAHSCLNPLVADGALDPDADGLTSLAEITLGTDPCAPDTDGDTMSDSYEAARSCLQPAVADGSADPDSDALSNTAERALATSPCNADTDGDGLNDGAEVAAGSDPFVGDTDGDGLSDGAEVHTYGTSPVNTDTDGDTLLDGAEVRNGTNPAVANPDPANPYDDGDACTDAQELGVLPPLGGDRDPLNKWDFFDVTGDQAIDLSDTLDVLSYFGDPGTDPVAHLRDRQILDVAKPWQTAESNDGIDLTDALNSLQSFGNDCAGPP